MKQSNRATRAKIDQDINRFVLASIVYNAAASCNLGILGHAAARAALASTSAALAFARAAIAMSTGLAAALYIWFGWEYTV